MKVKLTLTIDEDTIGKAKLYAKCAGRSLSEIVQSYLETLSQEQVELSAKLREIAGAVKLPAGFDEVDELKMYLENKHL